MIEHKTGTCDEWLATRLELLKATPRGRNETDVWWRRHYASEKR